MNTKILALLSVLFMALTTFADNVITYTASAKLHEITTTPDAIGFHVNVFNVSVTSHTFSEGVGTITFNGNLTSIGKYAFYGCSGLTSVTIPNSVTSIGKNAFSGCSGLTSVTIPNSVTSIGDDAFYCCSGLTSVTIPNSVTSISSYAFSGCSGLTSVTIPNSVTSIGNSAFRSCSSLTSVTIPNSVTSIGTCAFYNCSGLTSITIGNGVTYIGLNAFEGCTNLTTVVFNAVNCMDFDSYDCPFAIIKVQITNFTLGESVQHIPSSLCDGMSGLTSLIIPNNVTSIGDYAFNGCYRLPSVTIPNSVTSIGEGAFSGCSRLTSVTIPNSVTSIGKYAFSGCTGLTSVTIPNSVTSIGFSVFEGCSRLTSAGPIGGGYSYEFGWIQEIPDYAFNHCSGLTSVTIPNSVTEIGDWAFSGCSNLTSITIPNNITSIGRAAFGSCSGLTSVVWNAINCDIFQGSDYRPFDKKASQITSFVFGDEVESIPSSLCDGMSGLTSLIIPNSVTDIGDNAFYGCSGLTSVTIPNSVTSIGSSAFSRCSSLTSVTIPNSVTSISSYAFYGCSGLTSVTIPNSVTSIGNSAFSDCSCLTSVTIGNSVTSIGNYAFDRCSGLQEMFVLPTIAPIIQKETLPSHAFTIKGPCVSSYKSASYWKSVEWFVSYDSNDTDMGIVTSNYCDELTATPKVGYEFVMWNDSVTENPRIVEATCDTMFTAIFAKAYSGTCGDNLSWNFKEEILTIRGVGDMYDYTYKSMPWILLRDSIENVVIEHGVTSIGDYAFFGCQNRAFTKLVLPQSVKKIGNSAFADCNRLTSVVFSSDMEEVGDYAFSGCTRINDMTCYATVTPDAAEHTFDGVNTKAYLYVQAGSKRTYELDPYWGVFDIHEIGADSTVISNNQVQVVPADNEAVFTWPMAENADTYSLSITKDGEVFCTLTFNANGQLIGLAFAPSLDGSANAPAATTSIAGMSFTVTGLDGASKYTYRLAAKDATNEEIVAYSGEFATSGYEGEVIPGGNPENETALDNISASVKAEKQIIDGVLYIIRDGVRYTATGQRAE